MGWFASWGDNGPAGNYPEYDSSSQSRGKSAGILRWFARGGSHINQYNWAGGNHFARTAGSSMVGIYYWDAPIASDNLAQGPERLHIARTFAALASPAVAPWVMSSNSVMDTAPPVTAKSPIWLLRFVSVTALPFSASKVTGTPGRAQGLPWVMGSFSAILTEVGASPLVAVTLMLPSTLPVEVLRSMA